MTREASRCAGCRVRFPPSARCYFVTVTVGPAGARTLAFCDERCGGQWGIEEAARLRGWLQRIAVRTRGTGASLASQALFSDLTADGTPPTGRNEP